MTAKQRLGTWLRDRWRLDRFLGEGATAWVFGATHRSGRRVAIKMLMPSRAANPDLRRRFLREGYAANIVGHPGVVMVHDDDEDDDGNAFLVMELLDGANTNELRRLASGRLGIPELLDVADQLLDVLAAAHDRGVIHRDVKPTNLFISGSGQLKVLDFGIARLDARLHEDESTAAGSVLGTAAYMSPEQAKGRKIDARADVWSAGATLFRLATGEHVHPERELHELLDAAATRPARRIRDVAPDVPEPLALVIDRALAFEPRERWRDARSMQLALQRATTAGNAEGRARLRALVAGCRLPPPSEDEEPTQVRPARALRPSPMAVSRRDAAATLGSLGISAPELYLLELIPVFEMLCGDGQASAAERRALDAFLGRQVQLANELHGREVVDIDQARAFADRLVQQRPAPALLAALRGLIPRVEPTHERGQGAVLEFCLELGACSVSEYPAGDFARFSRAERESFEQLFGALADRQR